MLTCLGAADERHSTTDGTCMNCGQDITPPVIRVSRLRAGVYLVANPHTGHKCRVEQLTDGVTRKPFWIVTKTTGQFDSEYIDTKTTKRDGVAAAVAHLQADEDEPC